MELKNYSKRFASLKIATIFAGNIIILKVLYIGEVPEWPKGTVC
tara:strand:- start:120 stop:251 length:132 start_codon:yes stop_codon:yes gene_type:complete